MSVADAFVAACRAELAALKPGNVHRFADGHGMTVADFERSAEIAAPALARADAGVGRRVLEAVEATRAALGQNTNLGILLLAAPLAVAVETGCSVPAVLAAMTDDDARLVFSAIRRAAPGGLGRSEVHDVAHEPVVRLVEAMRAAQERDRIAWNYAHGFDDVLGFALPRLPTLEPEAVSGLYLDLLARMPDSHVGRKHGEEIAAVVQAQAQAADRTDHAALLRWDAALKVAGINPGTTADLVVATCFARALSDLRR